MTKIRFLLTFSLFLSLILVVKGVYAHGEGIAVVYPDLREPYRSIFTNIIDGIRDTAGDDIKTLAISKEETPEQLTNWVDENGIKSIIALGSRSQKLLTNLKIKNKIVGAITRPPKENGFQAGVLLAPDPGKIFSELARLTPEIKNLHVVYSNKHSAWYINIARQAAKEAGINLIEIESDSKKESLKHYQSFFKSKPDNNSAIWLLQDSYSSDSKLILPFVLEAAWDQKIPVITNKAGHVERGALFALYPDHFELGISLAEMSLKNEIQVQKYAPFTQSLSMANTRTAEHLDLKWTRKTKRNFNLVFPKQ